MKRSTDRILTTHVGSLPRPPDLLELIQAKDQGKAYGIREFNHRLRDAVSDIVQKQVELGIDVIDDGEYGKPGFVTYINERLGGFEIDRNRTGRSPWEGSREVRSFPEFYLSAAPISTQIHMTCTGPISYIGHEALQRDIDNLKAALGGVSPTEVFMPAISPANVEDWQTNQHYKSDEDYLFAIADALRVEYRTIIDAGFLLQIDDPRLVTYYMLRPDVTIEDCRKWAELRVEALNYALRDIPEDKIRFHTCYGINIGPRIHDMELKDIADIILKIRAGAYSLEAANPRHEHEWKVWESVKLPEGKILIPGVISHSTVLVEHPDLIAQRIMRFANVVGRENVIAGSDCGFATFAGSREIHPSIVWEKLRSLSEGAAIASRELWGRT